MHVLEFLQKHRIALDALRMESILPDLQRLSHSDGACAGVHQREPAVPAIAFKGGADLLGSPGLEVADQPGQIVVPGDEMQVVDHQNVCVENQVFLSAAEIQTVENDAGVRFAGVEDRQPVGETQRAEVGVVVAFGDAVTIHEQKITTKRKPGEAKPLRRWARRQSRRASALSALCALSLNWSAFAADAPIDYAAKIGPIFQEHCVDCHAAQDPDGDLNLETFEGLIKGGKTGKAIEPGNANDSLLVKFIEGRSGKEGKNKFMPPGKKEHLKPEEIALIKQWIDAGALPPALAMKPADVLKSLPKIAPKTARKAAIQALAFSPKARLIAAGSFASVQLIDAVTRQPARALRDIAGKVNALVFSPDGAMLFAAAGDAGIGGIAYQWRVSDGALMRKFEGHTDALYALALSPDGRQLATGSYDQKIKLWDVTTGAELKTLKGHNGGVFGLSFRPDGKVLASASADRTVKLWDVATGQRLDTFSQPLKEQTAVAFAPDGKTVAAAGADNRIRVWSVSDKALEGSNPLLLTRFAHEGAILNLAFSTDGRMLVSTAADKTVKLWNAADVTELHVLEPQPDWSPALAFVDGTKLALGRLDGSLAFYDTATGKPDAASKSAAMPMKPAAKSAAPAKPEITRIQPGGVQSGAKTTVKISGKNLAGITQVKFSEAGLSTTVASIDEKGMSAELAIAADAKVPRTQTEMSVVTAAGESEKKKLRVDYLPQIIADKAAQPTVLDKLPVNVWGTLAETGQQDNFRFAAKQGETIVLDLAAKRIESKAQSPRLEIFDANGRLVADNNGLDSGSDPFIAFAAPRDGDYTVRVREITLEGSPDHVYRLTAGALPYVTGWWPLSVPANRESTVHLVGHNLKHDTLTVNAGADGEVMLPLDSAEYRSRVSMKVAVSQLPEIPEQEPNDTVEQAQPITIPASVNGRLYNAGHPRSADVDLYGFDAEKGERLVIETRAAMMGSPADTKIEVLDAKGAPVPQLLLQATKDSWLTLRSTDATNPGIRLGQFAEMELNDYMYFNGEVLKIFRLARGPDSDMGYYARDGVRRAYFFTSPSAHGLDEPCYAVEPKLVGAKIVPNGLPVFTLNYANDDDAERELGKDSRLIFTAPATGRYIVRVSDTRGWSGERFAYRLIARKPEPDFATTLLAKDAAKIPAGAGVQFVVKVERKDGFEGDVRVNVSGVPDGFFVSTPIVVEAGHLTATGCLYALPGAREGKADFSKVSVTATASLNGQTVTRSMTGFPKVAVTAPPKQVLFIEPDAAGKPQGGGKTLPAKPREIVIAPGGRVPVWLRVERRGNDALLSLDVENLPHGVIVDSIGLNGVQIRANETEREVFLSCEKWVGEQDRLCHVVTGSARANESSPGSQASFPVLLKVRKESPLAIGSK
jgi:mono/diheme cytochrome c family protein